jgi:CheY-like chemotaxis protein
MSAASRAISERPDRAVNILVADADEETRLALVEAIAAVDPAARIVEACDGLALQAALAGQAPDVLFIDTILPSADAAQIMAWRLDAGARTVVVLVADLLADRWPRIAQRVVAYDVILKPLGIRAVERVLQAAVILRRELRVLVAEPSARTRELTAQVLRQSLFRLDVRAVEDGAEAARAARTGAFDLAVVGFGLTDVPALEVACRIDALQPGARIVIAGTAAETLTPAQLALFGARAFLTRPFSAADVDRLIYESFGLWRPYLMKALRDEEAKLAGAAGAVLPAIVPAVVPA